MKICNKQHCRVSILTAIIFIAGLAYGVPQYISYKAELHNKYGEFINGDISISFALYESPNAVTPLWSEIQNVHILDGKLDVQLGVETNLPITLFQQNDLYLGIKIGSDDEMTPRKKLASTGQVSIAELALSVSDKSISSEAFSPEGGAVEKVLISDGTGNALWTNPKYLPLGSIIAWSKTMTDTPTLPNGWEECNGQSINDLESPLDGVIVPDLNGHQIFLRGNTVDGGSSTNSSIHNHQWFRSGRLSYTSTGAIQTLSRTGSRRGYGLTSWIDNSETDSYTNNVNVLPPYYDVVWIIRVK